MKNDKNDYLIFQNDKNVYLSLAFYQISKISKYIFNKKCINDSSFYNVLEKLQWENFDGRKKRKFILILWTFNLQ